jgi:hypothetical protein
MSNISIQRFTIQIEKLQEILSRSKNQRSKGLYFYKNKGRDILFQLEGLCRVYRQTTDKKFFDRWYKDFKSLEDALGSMDHNETMFKEFSLYPAFKKSAQDVFNTRFDETCAFLSEQLVKQGWVNGTKLTAFKQELQEVKWKDDEHDTIGFANVLCEEMDKLVSKYRHGELDPWRLEEGMHEFRRRLRWPSIYSQAANGLIQLRPVSFIPDDFKNYCTPGVVNSPFNVLVKPPKGIKILYIQANYFYALSWLIGELSKWKDIGLRHEAFKEMTKASGTRDKALTKKFLDSCAFHPDEIAIRAESAIDQFIYRDFIPERISRDIMRSLEV